MQPGALLGAFRLESELGAGGMGRVFAAEVVGPEPGLAEGTRVALKIVHPRLLETPGFFQRFLREAQVGQAVRHPNVVRTLGCDAVGGSHFLVMELVDGQTLRALLDELGRVPEELCRHIGREVARGLQAIHEVGAVHRDLKPENVLITPDHTVKVMDLGVARLQHEAVRLSATGVFVGSLHYAAPEQLAGPRHDLDARADLYSLGLVLYELSTGRHPFLERDLRRVIHRVMNVEAPRVASLNPQLSPFLEEVVHTLLAKDPAARFESAARVAAVLEDGEASPWWQQRARGLRTATKQPLRRMRIPRETALYGRDKELARLRRAYDRARSGEGQVVLLEGEAGVGKSRLVDEFVGGLSAAGEDLNFLFGSYPPGGAATAAGAFSTAYREHFGREGLAEDLSRYLRDCPLLVPAYAALLRGEPTPRGDVPLTKESLQTVFVQTTHALAAERPTVILIDDLHFTPAEGLALFAALALAIADRRVLLIGTARRGLDEGWIAQLERHEHAERMPLSRLGPKDLFRLLEDAFGSRALADELAGRLAVKSDGNPFFAFEIIRGLREGRSITQRPDGTWATTQRIDRIAIPSSVIDLIRARISRLTDQERELLDVAACCGFEFDPLLAAGAAGLAPIDALRTLGRIEAGHHLIRSIGRMLVFDHHQVQEALYEGLSPQLREHYHTAIADTLEAGSTTNGATLFALAEHHLAGTRPERALRHLDGALSHLQASHMNEQATALASRALASRGGPTGRPRVELLRRHAGVLAMLGRREPQRAALDEALALARDDGGAGLVAGVEADLGQHLLQVSEYEQALAVLDAAREHAQEAGDTHVEMRAEGHVGHIAVLTGRYDVARRHHERALELARAAGDGTGELRANGNLGTVCWAEGRLDEARARYERCLELAIEQGDPTQEATATGNLGNVFSAQGRFDAAVAQHTRRLELARQVGDRRGQAIALHNLGGPLARLGALEQAEEHLRQSLLLCRDVGDRRLLSWGDWMLGEIAEWTGRGTDAEALYTGAIECMREMGDRLGLLPALTSYGSFLADADRKGEARRHLAEAAQLARATGRPFSAVYPLCRLALLGDGDGDAVRAALAEHAEQMGDADRMDVHFHLWRLDADRADLATAHELLTATLAETPPRHHAAMLANVPLYRAIRTAAAAST